MHIRLISILAVYLLCCMAPGDARGEDWCGAYTSALPAPQHEVQVTDEERVSARETAERFAHADYRRDVCSRRTSEKDC